MNKSIISSFLILFLYVSFVSGENKNYSERYFEAVNQYNKGDYKQAKGIFKEIADVSSDTKWKWKAKIYIVKCLNHTGHPKKAFRELEDILKQEQTLRYLSTDEIIKVLSSIKHPDALNMMKNFINNSESKNIRKKACELIVEYKNLEDKYSRKYNISEFLLQRLKTESDLEVAETMADSIFKLGQIKADTLINIYTKSSKKVMKRLLLLISKYDDEILVRLLQRESEKAQGVLRKYIKWALAKMDPYRFAQSFSGRLKVVDKQYYVRGYGINERLIRPEMIERDRKNLEKLVGKKITVYGAKTEGGLIYTDIYVQKSRR
ncbi:MAG: tetratricopeptide repeat protein [Elusimicrobiota bacterium]